MARRRLARCGTTSSSRPWMSLKAAAQRRSARRRGVSSLVESRTLVGEEQPIKRRRSSRSARVSKTKGQPSNSSRLRFGVRSVWSLAQP